MANSVWRMGRTAMVLAGVLAGCAQPPQPAATIAQPAVSFDGRYTGTVVLTGVASGADRSWCEKPTDFAVDVVNNVFTYSYALPNLANMPKNAKATYSAVVARDGSFQGQSDMTGVILGQITDGAMAGTVDGIGCAYRITASRS